MPPTEHDIDDIDIDDDDNDDDDDIFFWRKIIVNVFVFVCFGFCFV